jgi:hypothetical protein
MAQKKVMKNSVSAKDIVAKGKECEMEIPKIYRDSLQITFEKLVRAARKAKAKGDFTRL